MFTKNCRNLYVIIDDKVPCEETPEKTWTPIFAKCRNENEF